MVTKIVKKNNGELPQYYVEGNHPAIVSKELYNRVQEEMARRANKRRVTKRTARLREENTGQIRPVRNGSCAASAVHRTKDAHGRETV